MPNHQFVTLTREELYELVWSRPSTELAKEFGVSDVALAKTCRRYLVPKPPLGYWAKVQHGQKLKRESLPPPPNNRPGVITFHRHSQVKASPTLPETQSKIAIEKVPENQIKLVESLRSAHPAVRKTRDALQSAHSDEYGRLHTREPSCLNVCVSKQTLSRALLIWETLIRAAEGRGYSFDVTEQANRWSTPGVFHSRFRVDGELIEVRMEEPAKRHDRTPTEKEKKWGYWKKWDYTPSGKLHLIIETYAGDGHQKVFSDGKTAPLENRLNEFMCALVLVAESLKKRRLEEQRQQQLEDERRKRWEEQERRKREEEAKIRDLEAKVGTWDRSVKVTAFLQALEEAARAGGQNLLPGSKLGDWVAWAKAYAIQTDPIRRLLSETRPEGDPSITEA